MARYVRNTKTDKVVRIEFGAEEMARRVLDVEPEDLAQWTTLIPPVRSSGANAIYAVKSMEEIKTLKKRAALLRTRMNEKAVAAVEEAGLLDAYAELAEDCPEGITAHVWRSYGLVVLMQIKFHTMLGPEELAVRANLIRREGRRQVADVEIASKHIRLLKALGYLREESTADGEKRWSHEGLPQAWTKSVE